jgi:hypothetical protein
MAERIVQFSLVFQSIMGLFQNREQTTQHLMNTELSTTSHVEWSYEVNWSLTPSPRQINFTAPHSKFKKGQSITSKAQWHNTRIKEKKYNTDCSWNSIKWKSTKKSKQPHQAVSHPPPGSLLLRLSFHQTPWCTHVNKIRRKSCKIGWQTCACKMKKIFFLFGRNKGSN